MKHKKVSARILSLMLTAAMLLGMLPATALAAEGNATIGAGGIIECHMEHDAACGYKETLEGTPCSHKNEDGTYSCVTVSDNIVTPDDADKTGCTHEDDCGYTEAVEGADCNHSCEICKPLDSGSADNQPVQEQCACFVRCTEDGINTDCTVCGAAGADLTACAAAEPAAVFSTASVENRCEAITIAPESLNGNTVWGLTESPADILLDDYAGLYVKSDSHNGGTGGLPADGSLITGNGIPYQLAVGEDLTKAYDGNDSIRLTPTYSTQTMDLQTIGAYEKIYVLATAGGPGEGNYAKFQVMLTYTDGSTSETTYKLYDWYDRTAVDGVEQYADIYRRDKEGTFEKASSGAPILHSATIIADSNKLLKSISFKMLGLNEGLSANGLYCGIYAITGAVSADAPSRPKALPATDVNDGETPGFTANWTSAENATGYRLDVSELENFTTLVEGYNNLLIDGGGTASYNVTGLISNTTYYYRVRAVNESGQSLGSNRIATDLPQWVKKAGLSSANAEYDLETGMLKLKTGAVLTAPLELPADSVITLDLNSQRLTPPANQPSIKAPSGGVVELKLTDSSNPDTPPTLSGGSGQPAIDFSAAAAGSKVSLDAKTSVQGGNGVGNLPGGDGVVGGPGTSITLAVGAAATGGKGGEHGGKGGNGLTGDTVTLNGSATGGQGGPGATDSIPAGIGGTGADAKSITGTGSATGGNGGNGPTPGAGGEGAKEGTYNNSISVTSGANGTSSVTVPITGLNAPTKTYNGSPVSKSDFGTAHAGNDYNTATLTYTYYKASGGSLGELLPTAPTDAGDYILVVSTPTTDIVNVGQVTVPFSIAKASYTGTEAVAPDASKATRTDASITLETQTVAGKTVEYGYSAAGTEPTTWQAETTFGGLYANTEYYFFARVKASANYEAGAASTGTQIKTAKSAYTTPAAPAPDSTPASKSDTSITIKTVTPPSDENVEYAKSTSNTAPTEDSAWQTGTTFDGLSPNTPYFFFARVKENDTHAAGGVSAGTSITTDKSAYPTAPSAPNATPTTKTDTSITLAAVTAPDGEAFQYAVSTTNTPPAADSADWKDSLTFTGLTAATDYYFFARVKENDTHKAGPASDGTQITTDISDADKLAAAKIKVQTALLEMKATNDTKSTDILKVVNDVLSKVGTAGITAQWKADPNGFNKTLATESAAGSIKGKITLKLNSATVDVEANFPIARLIADKTALKEAIKTANEAKNGISVNNNAIGNVPSGTKFVSAAEMKALADAIAAAQTVANSTIATTPDVNAAVITLNGAVKNFKEVIRTGTYTSSTHKPVGNITVALTTTTAGTDLILTGMVTPVDASSKTIAWSIKEAGATGATMTGNKLSTIAAGTVVVTATITNGVAASTSYTQDFTIAVLAASGTASGMLKDEMGAPVKNATVTLMQGDEEKYTITTDAHGNYSFADIPNGVYKIVINTNTAPDVTLTDTLVVEGATAGKDIAVLDGNKSTVVESTEGTPNVAVGGMNDLLDAINIGTTLTGAEQMAVTGNGSAVLKFVADKKADSEVPEDKGKIETIATGQKIDMFLDLSVLKTVMDASGTAISSGEKVPSLATIIVAQIPIPASMQGKADLSVYRVHNNTAEALQKDLADANGEYYSISTDGTFITLHIKNFSTYALAYTAYTVDMTDGGTDASGAGSYGSGETVTINAGSKSGYSFDGWTVTTGTITLADASSPTTTFTMPSENVTVTANWKSNGGGGGSTTTTYPNTVNQSENGTVSIAPKSPSKGQTVTITTKPDAGYVVDTVIVKDANGKTIAVTEKGANSYTFVQPASKVMVEVTYVKAQTGGTHAFTDVAANDWFYDAVMAATANGWFSGTSATTFSPNAPTTRGMIATILHRMENTPGAAAASFADVASDAYYANGVAWAQEHGIVTGYGNGNYGPKDNITREQLAAILYRYATYKGYDMSKTGTLDSFTDASSVSGYATDALGWAVGSGLISGRGNNTLAPTATATRAEVAVILVRFKELFIK